MTDIKVKAACKTYHDKPHDPEDIKRETATFKVLVP